MANIECVACGITPFDFPLGELGLDDETVGDALFAFDSVGRVYYCAGCATTQDIELT